MNTVRFFKARSKRILKAFRGGSVGVETWLRQRVRSMAHVHLQKVQHVVAVDAGFVNWKGLINATEEERVEAVNRITGREVDYDEAE